MPNKDGIISIGFDYKKELEKMIKEFESEMDSVSSNTNLSKGMKAQFDNILSETRKLKADMDKELSNLGSGKVSQSSFKSFKQTVENKFKGIREDIDRLDLAMSTLNDSIDILGKGVDLSKISNEFKAFEDYVSRTNNAVEKLVDTLGEQGISLFSFDDRNITDFKNIIKQIDSALATLDKDVGEKFELFDEKEAQSELNRLSAQLVSTLELMENAKKQMNSMDSSTDGFKKAQADFASFQLKAASLNEIIETLYETTESKGIYLEMDDKSLSMYEKYTDDLSDNLESIISYAQNAKKELSSLLGKQKASSVKVSSELNPNSAEFAGTITIETTSSELWEILFPIMDDLQNTLNSNPVVAPIKLVVAPTAVSSKETGNLETSSAYSKKYQKVLAQTGEDAVIDLEGVYKKTFTSIMDEAVSYAKETIERIQGIFEKSPIKLHFDFNEDEFKNLSNALLSGESDKKIDITSDIAKSKKEVDNLVTSLEKVEEILSSTDDKKVSFKGFDKFAEDITKSLNKLTELQDMLKTLQNIEITLAKATGVSSVTEIESQWENVSKLISNAVKLDGTFRKNANVNKLASEYSKYLDMGGSNKLSDISKIKDNEEIISSILSKVKELNSQKPDTEHLKKADDDFHSVSSTLDGVISRLDHMINLTRDIGNTFYKMFKDMSVSDIDKQWSSIENKFSSIADESSKINLAKQKKDIQELMEMYKKYVDAGGMKSPFDLTDNTETIKKLNKVYEQLNTSKTNKSSVSKEGKNFDTVKESVDNLTSAINVKTETIKTEANTMELAARAEVKSIQKIIDALNPLIEKIRSVPELKIPKESDVSSSNKSNISSGNEQVENITNTTDAISKQNNALKELLLSWIEAQKIMTKSGSSDVEKIAFANSKNGAVSNSNFTGDLNSISEKLIRNIIQSTEESLDTMIHSHPSVDISAFSPEDIRTAIMQYASGIENQIIVGMNEISVMDVSKIKDLNPFDIYEKVVQEISILENEYVNKQLQNINGLQSVFNNLFDNGTEEWSAIVDLVQDNTKSDILQQVFAKYKEAISETLSYMDSDFSFNNSDELGSYIYDNIIKRYVRNYIGNCQPNIEQTEYNKLQKEAAQSFQQCFSDIYQKCFSFDDFKNLLNDNDIQTIAKQAFTNVLEQIGLQYTDVIKTLSIDQLKTSDFTIEDVFQEEKIGQTTSSAKELDKVLEQVNIPTESFDEVLSKLDLAKSELQDIVKITKQSVSDTEGKFHDSYTLKDSRGSTEIYGLNSNTEKGQLLRSNIVQYDAKSAEQETKALNSAYEEATKINNALNETASIIKNLPVPKSLREEFEYLSTQITELQTKLKNSEISVPSYNKSVNSLVSSYSKEESKTQSSVNSALKQQESAWKNIQSIREKIAKANPENKEYITQLQNTKIEYQKQYIEAGKILKTNQDLYDSELQISKLKQIELETTAKITKYNSDKSSTKLNNIETQISSFTSSLQKLSFLPDADHSFASWTNKLTEIKTKINELKTLKDNARIVQGIVNEEDLNKINTLSQEIKTLITEAGKTSQLERGWKDINATNVAEKIWSILEQNTKMSAEARAKIRAYYDEIRSGKPSAPLNEILDTCIKISQEERNMGRAGKSFFDIFKTKATYGFIGQMQSYLNMYFGFYGIIRYIKSAITTIKELDTALVDLKKTTAMTSSQLEDFYYDSNNVAKQMGVTTQEIIEQASAWSRLNKIGLLYGDI